LERIAGRLALRGRRAGGLEVQDVRAQSLRRPLETQAGTRGGFEEQGADRAAGKRAACVCTIGEDLGAIEQRLQGGARQAGKGQQMAQVAVVVDLVGGWAHGGVLSGNCRASCGAASQRSTMIAAATASSPAASRRRLRPSARSPAKRRAASTELERSSTSTTGRR